MILSLIVAVAQNGVIGKDGKIPWHISADLQRFKLLTMGHHIIMGRKTFESLKKKLKGRSLIILSKQSNYYAENCKVFGSVREAILYCKNKQEDEVFVIGGEEVFKEVLLDHLVNKVYLTEVRGYYTGDTYFRDFNKAKFKLIREELHDEYSFLDYIFCYE